MNAAHQGLGTPRRLRLRAARVASHLFCGLTGVATMLILGILAAILLHVGWGGRSALSWRFLTGGTEGDLFDADTAGLLPMLVGTTARVLLMTILVLPAGVLTAIFLVEYSPVDSPAAHWIRSAVNTLAGVPSIVYGLFGLGFFVGFVGGGLDGLLGGPGSEPRWGKPSLLWAAATLAVMTLPVVIIATEEALCAIPAAHREASLALGATRFETLLHVVLPEALPGILTGAILAISRAAGEVAPILFTGAAYYMARMPESVTDQFMDLGYHAFVLATQTPNPDATRPVLYGTVLVLLALTLGLNVVAMLIRGRLRRSRSQRPA